MTAPRLRPVVTVPHSSGPSAIVPGDTGCTECIRLTHARYTDATRGAWTAEARHREQMHAHWTAAHEKWRS
ncbi:hypothetical protein ACFP1Z_17730 [Streptomyces gamaensis]|uniref:Uncharacterized protein n=1 Tax=Streptomyces gamaensis TaxID=1763542 RepID=A0ABW0Z3S8_9ACTN